MPRRAPSTLAAVLPALFSAGCALEARYDIRVVESQKDAFLVLVHVDERLPPDEYRRIAEIEVQKFLTSRAPGDVPVYEVRLDFLLSTTGNQREEKLATFWWMSRNGEFACTMLPEGEHMLFLY